MEEKKAFVYMLRCKDDSLYTGITTDLQRRFSEHLEGGKSAAAYTRSHPPLYMAAAFEVPDLKTAARFEYAIKHLGKEKKEALVKDPKRITELIAKPTDQKISPVNRKKLPKADVSLKEN